MFHIEVSGRTEIPQILHVLCVGLCAMNANPWLLLINSHSHGHRVNNRSIPQGGHPKTKKLKVNKMTEALLKCYAKTWNLRELKAKQ